MADEVIWGTKDFKVPEYFNFADVIDEWAQKEKEGKRQSNNPALWWIDGDGDEVKWSFQEVALNSKKVANILSSVANVKPGERVMVIIPSIPEYWLVQAACLRTGCVFTLLPSNVGPKEVCRRMLLSKPVCVVAACCDQVSSKILDAIDQVTSSGDVDMRSRILINRMKDEKREGWLSYENLFQTASADYQSVKALSSAPVVICFTTGTTGNAKMIELSQASLGVGFTGMRKNRFTEADLLWCALVSGWVWFTHDAFFSAWSDGAGVFSHAKSVNSREAMDTLQRYPITQATFSASVYTKALEEEDVKSLKFPRLKRCYTGGETITKEMISQWREQTGLSLWNHYGQSEMNDMCLPRDSGDVLHDGSIGKPLPGVDMLIVDENNQELPDGKVGRMVIRVKPYRPVGMFTRYVDEPEKTAAHYSGDFYVTGDLGRRDADGHFWMMGRTDDMIKMNMRILYPHEVESILKGHPAVLNCAVVSSPLPTGQPGMKAFVELSNGFKNKPQDELIKEILDHVTDNAAGWMCPAKMEFMDDLPYNVYGKIDRRKLENGEYNKPQQSN